MNIRNALPYYHIPTPSALSFYLFDNTFRGDIGTLQMHGHLSTGWNYRMDPYEEDRAQVPVHVSVCMCVFVCV